MAFVFFNTQKETVVAFYCPEEYTSVFIVCLLLGTKIAQQINLFNKRLLNVEWIIKADGLCCKMYYAFHYIEKVREISHPGLNWGSYQIHGQF